MALNERSMVSISTVAVIIRNTRLYVVRRRALCANCGMYSVMMRPAISGARFTSRKIFNCTIASRKNPAEDSNATAIANTGVIASSDVYVRLAATCGARSSRQRAKTKRRNPTTSARLGRVRAFAASSRGLALLTVIMLPNGNPRPLLQRHGLGAQPRAGGRPRHRQRGWRACPRAHGAEGGARHGKGRTARPRAGSAVRGAARPRGMRRRGARLSHALRQHGGSPQVLHRRARRGLGARHARGQARRGVLLHRVHAWRPGSDAHLDDAAAAAPRHVAGGPSLYRAGPECHALGRLALRRDARLRRGQRPAGDRRGDAARVRARQAAGERRAQARGVNPALARRAWLAACACLVALILLGLAWELFLAPVRPGGSWLVLKILPLMAALFGVLRGRRYTFQWTTLLVWLYAAEGATRVWTDRGLSAQLALAELLLSLAYFASVVLYLRSTRAPPQ